MRPVGSPPVPWGLIAAVLVGLLVMAGGVWGWVNFHKPPVPVPPPTPAESKPVEKPVDPTISSCHLLPLSKDIATRTLFYARQGIAFGDQQKYNDAIKEFERAIDASPNMLTLHASRAGVEISLRKFNEAEEDLAAEERLTKCLSEPGITDAQLASLNDFDEPAPGRDSAAVLANQMRSRIRSAQAMTHYNRAALLSVEEQPDAAVAELKAAVHDGFSDRRTIETDPMLNNARQSKDFHLVPAMMP